MTIVGVDWTTNDSSPALTRIGPTGADLAGHVASWPAGAPAIASPGGTAWNAFGIWGTQRRCNLWDDGTPTAYSGDRCYTDTDIANMGQCMVKLDEHLVYVDTTLANHVRYYIANMSDVGAVIRKADNSGNYTLTKTGAVGSSGLTGFGDIHPAFIRNGVEKSQVYMGAFEGYVHDIGGTLYLESKAGVAPSDDNATLALTGTPHGTIANFRAWAKARNGVTDKWGIQDFLTYADVQLKYVIEYANFDAQVQISIGLTTGVAKQNTGFTGTTGTNLGNATGQVLVSNGVYAMSYRGIENWFGNTSQIVDGISMKSDLTLWVADHGFVIDTFAAPYTATGTSFVGPTYGSTGAVGALNYGGFVPSAVDGDSHHYLCDGHYNFGTTKSVFMTGGGSNSPLAGLYGGPFYFSNIASVSGGTNFGTRLAYIG